jgi:hypothetical protein
MTVKLAEPERQLVLGALDSLAVALADHSHTWTDGERLIYEQALEVLGARNSGGAAEPVEPDEDDEGEEWKQQ